MKHLVFPALALASGIALLLRDGPDAVARAAAASLGLTVEVVPQLVAGLLLGSLAQAILPREAVGRWLGGEGGWRSLALASGAGAVTPGGPFASFPLVHALWRAGADAGTLVAYLTAWSTLGLNRVLVWELPFMGADVTSIRLLASLPLPLLAALAARRLVRWRPLPAPGERA